MSGAGDRDDDPSESTELPMTDLSATAGSDAGDRLLAAIAKAPSAPPPRDLEAGVIVGHGFRIERKLGAGGMGVVYLARDMTLERDVALKVHRAHGGFDRLQREAVAMARLAHPNVITVHEIGRVGDRLFVAMEYVAGHTLREWMSQPRGWRDVVAIMRQVGEGMCAAHDAGLVHRDFKPENVLVGPDGRPRVGDFGLVRVVGAAALLSSESGSALAAVSDAPRATPSPASPSPASSSPASSPPLASSPPSEPTQISGRDGDTHLDEPAPDPSFADTVAQRPVTRAAPSPAPVVRASTPGSGRRRRGPDSSTLVPAELSTDEPAADRLTATGTVLGTPAYMAPEQFAGERVDARADQFAFCIVLYEAMFGQRPFAGRSHGDLLRSIEDGQIRVPPPGRGAPRWLRRVLERGLAARPEDRFPTLRALLAAIDRGTRRRRRAIVAVAVAAVAAAIAIGLVVVRRPRAAGTPCADAGADLDAIWSPASHARLTAAATAADAELGPRVAARVADRADELRRSYRQASARACIAHEVEDSWDDDMYRRTRDCLDESVASLRWILAKPLPDRKALGELLSLTAQLPVPDRCAHPTELARTPTLGHGLVTGQAALALFHEAQAIDESHEPVARRQARLDRIEARARGIGSQILDARVLLARASLASARADLDATQDYAQRAFVAARSAGDDDRAFLAAIMLVRALGVEQTRFDAARPWQLQVLAEAERSPIGGDDGYLAVAAMAERESHFEQAIEYTRKAIALLEERGDTDGYAYAFALDQLAAALDEAGHGKEAIVEYQKAIALDQKLGGPDNPGLFNDYVNLSLALVDTGEAAGAVDAARHALALAEQWHEVLSADSVPAAFLNLGVAYSAAGQPRLAEIAFVSARAGYRALPGDHRDSLVLLQADLAITHQELHRYAEATAEIEEAVGLYHELGQDDSVEACRALLTQGSLYSHAKRCPEAIATIDAALARFRRIAPDRGDWVEGASSEGPCLRSLGRAADSVALLEAALATIAEHPVSRSDEGNVRWQLALGLHALDREPARARQQGIAARAAFVADGLDRNGDVVAEIDAALAIWP